MSFGATLVLAGVHESMMESQGGKWCPPASLFLEKSPKDPCLSSTSSEISIQIQLLYTQVFSTLSPMLYLQEAVFLCWVRTQFPLLLPFPELVLLMFKVPGVKSH